MSVALLIAVRRSMPEQRTTKSQLPLIINRRLDACSTHHPEHETTITKGVTVKVQWYRGFTLGFLLAVVLVVGVNRVLFWGPKPIINTNSLAQWQAHATPEMKAEMETLLRSTGF